MYYTNLQAQQLQPQQLQPQQLPIERISVCIYGMGCKNVKCSDYHHPSKDLDIHNTSKGK